MLIVQDNMSEETRMFQHKNVLNRGEISCVGLVMLILLQKLPCSGSAP